MIRFSTFPQLQRSLNAFMENLNTNGPEAIARSVSSNRHNLSAILKSAEAPFLRYLRYERSCLLILNHSDI